MLLKFVLIAMLFSNSVYANKKSMGQLSPANGGSGGSGETDREYVNNYPYSRCNVEKIGTASCKNFGFPLGTTEMSPHHVMTSIDSELGKEKLVNDYNIDSGHYWRLPKPDEIPCLIEHADTALSTETAYYTSRNTNIYSKPDSVVYHDDYTGDEITNARAIFINSSHSINSSKCSDSNYNILDVFDPDSSWEFFLINLDEFFGLSTSINLSIACETVYYNENPVSDHGGVIRVAKFSDVELSKTYLSQISPFNVGHFGVVGHTDGSFDSYVSITSDGVTRETNDDSFENIAICIAE